MRRSISALLVGFLAISLAPQAIAQTSVQGGPLTNLNLAGDKIHLALSGYPTSHGLYIYQAVKPDAGARPTLINTASQVWVGTAPGATDPKGDIVINVDNGHAWSADCAHQICGIFIRMDHTSPTENSEDQFIPITFSASSAPVVATPTDTLSVKIDGMDAKENVPGNIAYRQVVTFSATSGSGAPVTLKSYTPNLCPLSGNTVTALKGSGQCDIAVSVGSKSAHFPFIVGPGIQSVKTSYSGKVGKTIALAKESNFGEMVSYSTKTSKVCTVKGRTLKLNKKGNCLLEASSVGTENYSALKTSITVSVK